MTELLFVISAITLNLVVLHRMDGGDVIINPSQVTSLRVHKGKFDRLLPEGNCLVGLTDGKFVAVIESCTQVKQLLESAR